MMNTKTLWQVIIILSLAVLYLLWRAGDLKKIGLEGMTGETDGIQGLVQRLQQNPDEADKIQQLLDRLSFRDNKMVLSGIVRADDDFEVRVGATIGNAYIGHIEGENVTYFTHVQRKRQKTAGLAIYGSGWTVLNGSGDGYVSIKHNNNSVTETQIRPKQLTIGQTVYLGAKKEGNVHNDHWGVLAHKARTRLDNEMAIQFSKGGEVQVKADSFEQI